MGPTELYTLKVPSMWIAWVLLLWQYDYCGHASRWFIAGPALCGGHQLLCGWAYYWTAGCLTGVILVPISKWAELAHEETGYEALWDPRSSTGPLVDRTRFQSGWLLA